MATESPTLQMTAGDNDEFIVTLVGIDLTTADFYRIRMNRPSTVLQKEGIAVDLAQGQFLIKFDSATDLETGNMQAVDIKWSIGGDVLTAKEVLFIDVKAAV